MRYTVVLERELDGGYVANVPALPGCVSQGDSREEALANVREAIELYVEDCRAAGDAVPTEVGREFVEIEAGIGAMSIIRGCAEDGWVSGGEERMIRRGNLRR